MSTSVCVVLCKFVLVWHWNLTGCANSLALALSSSAYGSRSIKFLNSSFVWFDLVSLMFARIICRSSLFELSPAHRSSWINSMALPNRRLMATENAPASDSASVISGALKEARRKVRGSETAPAKVVGILLCGINSVFLLRTSYWFSLQEKKLEARAKSYTIPASIKKLNDVASLIRGTRQNRFFFFFFESLLLLSAVFLIRLEL